MTKRAMCLLRSTPHYRADAFRLGLERNGYCVFNHHTNGNIDAYDLLVIWNRYGIGDNMAKRFEKQGKPVIVVENGYVGHDKNGRHLFAMALNYHNGAGKYPEPEYDRWSKLNIELQSWVKHENDEIIVLPQRGIGPEGVAMPSAWLQDIKCRYHSEKLFIRPHPGNKPCEPIEHCIRYFKAAITWGSGAAIKSIIAGVPVCYGMTSWIGRTAASTDIDNLYTGDRLSMLQRLSWAQWTVDEIIQGDPIRRLVELHNESGFIRD